ncbi:large ribosomal subunit protein mL41 [Culicoides brevitarsis]|uniref:large ribosomal subunit protein mL41 n=1 Tax=Culicoides brevitarsis TaxID=469753 RepID=UPI00307B1896
MSSLFALLQVRQISTTAACLGKKNFRKFLVPNKRGTRHEKAMRGKPGGLPIDHRGVRPTGIYDEAGNFIAVPEMVPEIIVPDLKGCEFQPYVSYRTPDVTQSEFTSQDLFNAVYAKKIVEDFKANKLNEAGEPLEPSPEEKLTPDEAIVMARKTGSDFL